MSLEDAHRSRSTSPSVLILAAIVLALPMIAIGVFAALARTDDIDAYLYAYYAKRLLAGQRLYVDLWDNKPPGVFWVDAVGLLISGGRYVGIAIMCSLFAAGSCGVFFLSARRLYGTATASVALVMAALYLFLHDYHVGSNRPSTFYVLFELLVFTFYVHSFHPPSKTKRRMFWAGVCAVAAVSFRQTAFAAAAAVAGHQIFLLVTGRQTREQWVDRSAAFFRGCATALLVVVAMLWWTGDFAYAWFGVVSSNLGYFSRPGKSDLLPEMYRWEDHLRVLGLPLILAIGATVHAVATRFSSVASGSASAESADRDRPPAMLALLIAWLAIAVYLALVGPSKRMMYFGVALAPLMMLASRGISLLLRRDGDSRSPRFSVIVGVLWFAYMMAPAVKHQSDAAQTAYFRRFDDRSSSRYAHAVATIHQYTHPNDAIYMWGYLPAVYWYADRPLAQRYIVTTLMDQLGEHAQPYIDRVVEDLKRTPPKAIVLGKSDLKTIESHATGAGVTYGDFGQWLRAHYALPPDCKSRDVWIRND